jgi:hypothetical protein
MSGSAQKRSADPLANRKIGRPMMKLTATRNPLASPPLPLALQWLRPGPEPRIDRLIRAGRTGDAAELVAQSIADADRP